MIGHHYHLDIERQRRAESRRARHLHSSGFVGRPPRRRFSRAVGRLMIDVGSRLAADPVSERARSR